MSHLPATSPYAPRNRNSYLRRRSTSSISSAFSAVAGTAVRNGGVETGKRKTTTVGLMAIILIVIQFWKDHKTVIVWGEIVQRPAHVLLLVVQSVSAWMLRSSSFFLSNSSRDDYTSGNRNNAHDTSLDRTTTMMHPQQRIKENCDWIERVLQYWFGQYTPEKSQKKLWMIAASSIEHRQMVDREISDKFTDLLMELSSTSSSSTRWKEWTIDPNGIYGARGKIAAIIVLDQFSRHILRHHKQQSNVVPFPVSQESLDNLAFQTAQLFKAHHSQEMDSGMIPLPMYIFALMPYRHANTIATVQYVQDEIEHAVSLQLQVDEMLGRFRKATNRRMAVLQDEARRSGKKQQPASSTMTSSSSHSTCDDTHNDDDATSSLSRFTDEDILEAFPFEVDLKTAVNHPIHKTIVEFLADRGIYSTHHTTTSTIKKAKKEDDLNLQWRRSLSTPISSAAVIVSLSGGVDSMVIASVLSHLKKSCGYRHLTVLAIHIDYANRPESKAEADYVQRYCGETYLDIDFVCRRIDEVTRGITARDDYERIARTIRYDSYREAVSKMRNILQNDTAIVGVMLGHHRGDLRENVLSNAHKGCGPLDLSGMTSVSKNDGVWVYRPLLPLEKSVVLDYAHKFGVPYFKDTTPHWSTRGKLRNKLLPLLEEIYGEGCMNNLSNLAVESDECRFLFHESIIDPFMEAIERKPMGIIINTTPWKKQPMFFWKFALREALHSARLGMFSDKSVTEFVKRVQAEKLKNAWLQCRKDYGVFLQADGKAFVFYPDSFPWNKKDPFCVHGQVVDFDTDVTVGPWIVRAEFIQDASQNFTDWLSRKAVSSMEKFMTGRIEYFVPATTTHNDEKNRYKTFPRPPRFGEYSKNNRPQAWKNVDLRIQSTLPLLAVSDDDQASDEDLEDESCLIRVRLEVRKS